MTTHTVKEIAPQLGVSTSTVYRWLASGEITQHGYTGHKQGRRWIITSSRPGARDQPENPDRR